MPKWDSYSAPPIDEIKSDAESVVTEGPIVSMVLRHANMLHMAVQNTTSDVIRQATIRAFAKTPESVSDETVLRDPYGDLLKD